MENLDITGEKSVMTEELGANYFDKVLSAAIDVGCGLLSCGCPVGRVEIAVEYICKAYGAEEANVSAFPSMIMAGVKLKDGRDVTQIKRVYSISNNFAKMEAFNQLSRDICKNRYPIDEAAEMINKLKKSHNENKFVAAAAGGIGAGSFAVFYGGALIDFLPAMIVGGLMAFLNCILCRLAFNGYARTFMLSLIGGVCSLILCFLLGLTGLEMHLSTVMMGTIMIVIPGLLICNAIRDLFSGDIYSGTFELLNGIITTLAIVAGYGVAMSGMRIPAVSEVLSPEKTFVKTELEDYLYRIVFCLIGTTAFTLFFGGSVKKLLPSEICAMVTFSAWLVFEKFIPLTGSYKILVDMLLATLIAAMLSEIFARTFKAPSIVFFVPGIIIFVPGRSLYLTVDSLISGQTASALSSGKELGLILVGIVVGIIIVTLLFQLIKPTKHRKYLRKKIKDSLKHDD